MVLLITQCVSMDPKDSIIMRLTSSPDVIKLFSCSAQLRLKFILLINNYEQDKLQALVI